MLGWCMVALAVEGAADTSERSALEGHDARGTAPIEVPPAARPAPVVLFNGTLLPASGPAVPNGWIALVDGRIQALGEGVAPEVAGASRIDLAGRFVTPGLIDTHSHLGVYPSPGATAHEDGNEMTRPSTPGVWAEHSLWPQDPGFQRALAGGVTALQVLPGSANLIGGRGFIVQNVPTLGSRAMAFPGAPQTVKMACGENPKRVYGEKGGPSTRMGNLAGQRQAFLDAVAYQQKWDEFDRRSARAGGGGTKKKKAPAPDRTLAPDRSLDKETLVGVMEGRILPQIHCYRADDMIAMLQVADEFGFQVRSFHHAVEAYKIADLLAEHQVSASVWADWWGFKLESFDGIPTNAALVSAAGARAVIHSDDAEGIQRLNQEASKAWHAGRRAGITLPEEEALRWITLNPAWTLGIEDQTGSLEAGKRADVVVWDQHPFSVYASADLVWVAGDLRWDREDPALYSDFEAGWTAGQEVP